MKNLAHRLLSSERRLENCFRTRGELSRVALQISSSADYGLW